MFLFLVFEKTQNDYGYLRQGIWNTQAFIDSNRKGKSTGDLKNRECPLKYVGQKRAWMDVTTCWYWFDNIFLPEVRKHTRHPVIFVNG